jgi:hypothetical protein
LLSVLVRDNVCTRRQLEQKIREAARAQTTYLTGELEAFLHVEHRKEFRKRWNRLYRIL